VPRREGVLVQRLDFEFRRIKFHFGRLHFHFGRFQPELVVRDRSLEFILELGSDRLHLTL